MLIKGKKTLKSPMAMLLAELESKDYPKLNSNCEWTTNFIMMMIMFIINTEALV